MQPDGQRSRQATASVVPSRAELRYDGGHPQHPSKSRVRLGPRFVPLPTERVAESSVSFYAELTLIIVLPVQFANKR